MLVLLLSLFKFGALEDGHVRNFWLQLHWFCKGVGLYTGLYDSV